MAMQLSRVRSATINQRRPVPPIIARRRSDELTPTYNRYSLPSEPHYPFPEPERSVNDEQLDYGEPTRRDSGENPSRIDLLSPPVHLGHQEHDDSHMVSRGPDHRDLDMEPTGLEPVPSMGELPMYRPMSMQHPHPRWDFSVMEEFATTEKVRLGIPTTQTSIPVPTSRVRPSQEAEGDGATTDATISTPTGFTLPPRRTRERKLSSSAGNTRRGKMALFEQAINNSSGRPPMSTRISMPEIPEGSLLSSSENIPGGTRGGHDGPYRFSFYSNALSKTIHSRSLSELPAEGQSFEELFTGILPPELRSGAPQSGSASPGTNGNGSTNGAPADFAVRMGLGDQVKKGNGDPDPETATWWLDVMSPTDEEMKLLSHVSDGVLTE